MTRVRLMHPAVRGPLVAVLSILALGACESAESKEMNALAGRYAAMLVWNPDEVQPIAGVELTLRADGRWQMAQAADSLLGRGAFVDSGTYRVSPPGRVVIRSSDEFRTYVVRGDTLVRDPQEQQRIITQTEALSGIKIAGQQVEPSYVRMR